MRKERSVKQRLISAVLVLVMLFSSLLGTTFAWFTDQVSSAGNQIVSGTLKVDLSVKGENDEWVSLKQNPDQPIFDYKHWEPGYTRVEQLKVDNLGTLALKYQLSIEVAPDTADIGKNGAKLSDVIDVYIADGEKTAGSFADITQANGWTHKGTLTQVIEKPSEFVKGQLKPDGQENDSQIVTIALHMQESAGNEYQNLSAGDIFVNLIATQASDENDSFGKDYDDKAEFPEIDIDDLSIEVEVEGGFVKTAKSASRAGVSITVPAGVKVDGVTDGTATLVLSVDEKEKSDANVTLSDDEILRPLDVHVEGVADDNQTAIVITVEKAMPSGLNIGNYTLYHVENGASNEMSAVTDSTPDEHNEFYYAPATGDTTLAMATFSEVAVVAEPAKWKGNRDYSWYDANATELVIANADQLAGLSAIVGGMDGQTQDSFSGKTVKLIADVNLGDKESENNPDIIFYPIGYNSDDGKYEKTGVAVSTGFYSFMGEFDGNGHTIANFYQNTWEMKGDHNWYDATLQYYRDGMGLFGKVYGGTVKNLTVKNFTSDGEITTTGVIAAYADCGATFENIAIFNCNPRVYNIGNGGIVGCVGWYAKEADLKTTFTNITVDNSNKISALWGSYDVACGGIVGQYYPTSGQTSAGTPKNGGIEFVNCHVAAQMDVYNDVCANYQYYAYRYTGMLIGSVRENETIDGHVYPKMDGITASGCTVHFGTWNDYYYCEIIDNTTASYTHDYQMSRLTEIKAIDGTTITYLDGTTGTVPASGRANYVIVDYTKGHGTENATCYHFKDGVVWNHEDAGYHDGTDGGKIVDENGDGNPDLREDKQHIYLEFNNLVTGYGWGVTSKGIGDLVGVTILDKYNNGSPVEKFEIRFKGDFLYRVGNMNPVSLDSLFAEIDPENKPVVDSGVHVTIEAINDNMTVSGVYDDNDTDWTQGTIQFSGTGVVKVTIQDYIYCTPTVLYLEVVDAYNRTTASFGGNSVLLNDVSTSTTLSTSGIIYGNGFTVNMENAPITEKNGAVFHLYDGAILKNLGIVGKEFTTVATTVNDTNYGVSAVRAWGTVVIENCYISGCRAPVSVTGTELTIKDSVIANGVYANIDFRSGILNLHNVTTINEPHTVDGTTIVGLGIVGNMTASAGRQINITGTLTQYNWLSQADCSNIKASGVSSIFNSVFTEDKYASLRYTYNGTTYVNTGILSLCSDFGASAATGVPSNYGGMDVTATIASNTVDGYVWAPAQAGTLTPNDMQYHDSVYEWAATDQGSSYIPPALSFTNAGLTTENGVAQIEYESGSSYTLAADTVKKLFNATKYGQALSYKVSLNGVDYTDKDIVFDAATSQTYTITFTVIDNLVYDKDGKLTETTYEITKELDVFATVVDKGADAPTFTFYYGTNGSASAGTPHTTQPTNSYKSTIKQVGEAYYIMPNVSATSANAIGSQTVDGTKIYYPIVDGINVRSGDSTDYDFTRYYPVFKAVNINDNGTEYTYSGTTEMPATVAWVSATIDSGNGASALNDGFGLYNNQYLCKIQKKAGNAESGGTSVVKFSYTALDGNTYYYYVGFRFYDEDEGGICLTPDTLITLADGSQKEIQYVRVGDEVLAWNFYTGQYEIVPVSLLQAHDTGVLTVLHLYFEDGTELKVLGEHGIFDADLNTFIFIDEDDAVNYVGHNFVKQDGDSFTTVKFIGFDVTAEYTTAYTILSADHYNVIAEGMFTVTPAHVGDNFFNPFDVGEDMKYDEAAVQADIEKYGLYTYEDFDHVLTYEQYEALNLSHFKVSVGKGYITYEGLIYLIENFVNNEDFNI